jgi:hypothetical protein
MARIAAARSESLCEYRKETADLSTPLRSLEKTFPREAADRPSPAGAAPPVLGNVSYEDPALPGWADIWRVGPPGLEDDQGRRAAQPGNFHFLGRKPRPVMFPVEMTIHLRNAKSRSRN